MSINKSQGMLSEMKCQQRANSQTEQLDPSDIDMDDREDLIEHLRRQTEEIASKDRELESLRDQLAEAKGEIATAQIAITVRHEINNPLTSILGQTQLLLLRRESLSDDVAKRLEVMEQLSIRIRDIVKKLEVIKQSDSQAERASA